MEEEIDSRLHRLQENVEYIKRNMTNGEELLQIHKEYSKSDWVILGDLVGRDLRKELQQEIVSNINKYLQEWLRERGKEGYIIKARDFSTFPSIYAVYTDEEDIEVELVQFSILEGYYGVRIKAKSDEELDMEYRKKLQRIVEEEEKLQRLHKKWKYVKENPRKHYTGIKNWFAIMFHGKDKLERVIGNILSKLERQIEHVEKRIENEKGYQERRIRMNRLRQEGIFIEDFLTK